MRHPIQVTTRSMDDPDLPPTRKIIDYWDKGDRSWLDKHVWYCLQYGNMSVTLSPINLEDE